MTTINSMYENVLMNYAWRQSSACRNKKSTVLYPYKAVLFCFYNNNNTPIKPTLLPNYDILSVPKNHFYSDNLHFVHFLFIKRIGIFLVYNACVKQYKKNHLLDATIQLYQLKKIQ